MSFLTLLGSTPGLIVPSWPPTAVSQHAITGVSLLQASVDPFKDPVFSGALSFPLESAAAVAESTGLHLSPLITGLVFYVVGMFALTSWDKKVLPGLQRKGILPYISSTDRTLDEQLQRREAEKRAKNLTPITAQHRPAVAELDSQACHYIGTVNGVRQYLCVRKDNAIGEQCDFSEEFSAMYKQPVVICKKADPSSDVRDMAP